jgi:hypothetical protein
MNGFRGCAYHDRGEQQGQKQGVDDRCSH